MKLTINNHSRSAWRGAMVPARRPIVVATVVFLLLVIAWLDYATGAAPVQHLYYLPIILAASDFDYPGGVASALVAVGLYHFANEHLRGLFYTESDYLQIALFIAVGVVTARLASNGREMRRLAHTDDLTGLHNLRSFESGLIKILGEAQKKWMPAAMLVLDLDRLKAINEAHSHLAGAEAVRAVGHLIADCFDGSAVACRYGGDEFAIIVPDCGARAAFDVAENLRRAVENYEPILDGRAFLKGTLTVSIGIAIYSPDGSRNNPVLVGEELFRSADSALYCAKREGRNRVSLNTDLAEAQLFVGETAVAT